MQEVPVSIVITRHVRAGSEADFEALLRAWIPRLVAFPGHQGALILQPLHPSREYGAVLRFRSLRDWEAFREWNEYRDFLGQLNPLLEVEPHFEQLTGLEAWFTAPGRFHPQRWKMAVVTWVGVCLTVGTLSAALGTTLASWQWLPRLLAMNAAVVAALTWGVMPVLTWMASWWLVPRIGPPVRGNRG